MRVLVCGGRDYEDREAFFWHMTHSFDGWRDCEIISGMAKGADSLAVDFARTYGLKLHKFPADWATHGKAAGPIRNQRMIDEGNPDLVVAFPGGRGTQDMTSRAKKAGVEVIDISKAHDLFSLTR